MIKLFLICLIYSSIAIGQAARILAVFPAASISHQVVFRPIVHELVKRGHEVVLITPDPAFPNGAAPANLTEIDVHDISYNYVKENLAKDEYNFVAASDLKSLNLMITRFTTYQFEAQLKSDQLQNFLKDKSQKFDLILLEAFVRPALVLSHLYKAPVIQVSSFGPVIENLDAIGAPTHPILYPLSFTKKINNLNLWDKFDELYNYFENKHLAQTYEDIENEMLRRVFGKDIPTAKELTGNVEMVFFNVHPLWDSNRPVPPNVVYMGGLPQKPKKELPQELKKFLDSSKNGVIYMSFGSNILPSMFPAGTLQLFLNVLSTLPYNILWKWSEEVSDLPKNIMMSTWFPQSDLLRHTNVKLFITQGGLQSTDESITAGVPFVGIPMWADLWYNVEMYKRHKIGVGLDILTLTEDKFRNAILMVLKDDSYRINIVKLREKMIDQPQSPLERAVWWTEHVLRHGGARHLRSPAANMPWTQYYEIELLTYLLAGLVSVLVISALVVKLIFKMVLSLLFSKSKVKMN